MKLFYITASFPFGSGESFLIPEIKALRNESVNIIVVPLFPRGALRNDWENLPGRIFLEKLISLKILNCFLLFSCFHPISLYKLIVLLKDSTFSQFFKNLAILPKSVWISSIIKAEKPDHIHVHWGSTTSSAVMLASVITTTPWSLTCHRWDIYENNLLRKKSERSEFIRFISEKGKTDALRFGVLSEKSVLIPMGTEIPSKPNSPVWEKESLEFIVMCPANLIPVKGHIYLIEAVDILVNESYKIKLLIAGEGFLRKELEILIKEKGICANVDFLGQLPHKALLDYYSSGRIHLMVLPSIDLGNGEHEGVPVSLMEAMSYGVPVISTETGSINELLPKEIGLTIPDKSANELALKIKFLYDNPDEYNSASKLCRKIIKKNWNINTSAKALITLIRANSDLAN
ncbi:MAG: glycosyltransferase family 4 protein [Bacteroidia bacterium]|nr:glycosyltransferase family 4 protein [Bacteroidia bacterium]